MRYQHTMTYDAPVRWSYKMLTDPQFQQQRAEWGRPVAAESTVTPGTVDAATIWLSRTLHIDPALVPQGADRQPDPHPGVPKVWGDGDGAADRNRSLVVDQGTAGGVNGTLT